MRIPILLALLVVLTLPKDVHGLVDTMSTQVTSASAAVTNLFDRGDDPVQVAETATTDAPKVMAFSVR